MDVLSRLFDAPTQRVLERRGARGRLALPGDRRRRWQRRALDGRRVGPQGHVLCTDLDTRIIEESRASAPPNLEVMRHDIANDPLPARPSI